MAQQGTSKPLRQIAPRMTPGDLLPSDPAPSDESKAKRASMACAECKRRRTKCSFDSTGNPCSECSLQGSECIVDEAADKRRKAAGRRIQEELLLYQDTLKVAQEQIKVLQQELRDTKYEFSMMLMEKERVLDATSIFLDKLLGVLRKNDSTAFGALIGTIRSGAGNAQIMGVLDQLMP